MDTMMIDAPEAAATAEATPRVYLVPEGNYETLKADIARLQRRAKKLSSDAIVLNELGFEDYPGYVYGSYTDRRIVYVRPGSVIPSHYEPTSMVRRVYSLTVSGPAPVLEGTTFIGAIDVIRDDEGKVVGNMVRVLPEREMPDVYRTAEPHCDHCGIKRNWKTMYVVLKDGSHFQVGRQCLKDFTGHKSPEHFAAMAELMMAVNQSILDSEEEECERSGGRMRQRYSVKSILTMVATIVRKDGWKPKSQEFPTVDTLRHWLYARGKELEKHDAYYDTNDEDRKTAEDTLEWLLELSERAETLNDYEHNLSLFALAGSVEDKVFGFVASAIAAYLRTKDRLLYAKKEAEVSNFVSEVAKRIEMTLTLKAKFYRESAYGVQTRCKYHDEQGNVIIWWASSGVDMEEGTKVRAKATVKNHEEYNGIKQTIVSRLAVIEVLSTPEVNS